MFVGSRKTFSPICFFLTIDVVFLLVLLQPASSCASTSVDGDGDCSNCPSIYTEMCDGQETECSCTCPNTVQAMFQVIRDDAASACETTYTCPGTTRAVLISSGSRAVQAAGSNPQLTCADPGSSWVDPSGNAVTGVTCADECAFCPLYGFYRDNCNGVVADSCQTPAMVTITQTRNDVSPGGCDITLQCPTVSQVYAFKSDGTAIYVADTSAVFPCTDATSDFTAPTSTMSSVVGATCGNCVNCAVPYANNCNGLARMTCPDREMGISDAVTRVSGGCTYLLLCGPLQTIYFPTSGGMMVDPGPLNLMCTDSPTDGKSVWVTVPGGVQIDAVTCASAT